MMLARFRASLQRSVSYLNTINLPSKLPHTHFSEFEGAPCALKGERSTAMGVVCEFRCGHSIQDYGELISVRRNIIRIPLIGRIDNF